MLSRHVLFRCATTGALASHIVAPAFLSGFKNEFALGTTEKGLKCFRQIPRQAYLKTKAAEAYLELSGTESDRCGTSLSTFFEVVFFCYFLYAVDLYFDIDLINSYRDKSLTFGSKDNISVNWTQGLKGLR